MFALPIGKYILLALKYIICLIWVYNEEFMRISYWASTRFFSDKAEKVSVLHVVA
jgi:hypothetical protein